MPNRVKCMDLVQIVSKNLDRIMKEHDLSTNELANRSGLPQKTCWSLITGSHAARLDNLEKIAKALLVSPTALVTPHLPTNVVMSRRIPRLVDNYGKLDMQQRDELESFMAKMLSSDEEPS